MVRRRHYCRAPRGLRPMYADGRHNGGACRRQSFGSARAARRQSRRHDADVALVWKFTRATLAHDAAADEYREAIVKRWGRRALVSLAFAITAARIYPTVKYALGHGTACVRVVVGGTPVTFDHGRVSAPTNV